MFRIVRIVKVPVSALTSWAHLQVLVGPLRIVTVAPIVDLVTRLIVVIEMQLRHVPELRHSLGMIAVPVGREEVVGMICIPVARMVHVAPIVPVNKMEQGANV